VRQEHPRRYPRQVRNWRAIRCVVGANLTGTTTMEESVSKTADSEFADAGLADMRLKNPVYRKMAELRQRSIEVIAGRARLLIAYGPPGIGKSIAVSEMLDAYSRHEHKQWLAQPNKDERRTEDDGSGVPAFRPPFSVIQGGTSFPVFYCRLFWASYPGEVLFVDDVSSLNNKAIQACLMQATDPTHNGRVYYNFRVDLPDDMVPKRYSFRGGIIIVTNFRKTERDKKFREMFSDPVLDRAIEVDFPWDKNHLLDYVVREAFTKRGLLKYLVAPADRGLPQPQQGLGFTGSDPEAEKLLDEVRDFFVDKIDRVPQISFRTVQKILKDRVFYPNHWRTFVDDTVLGPMPRRDRPENKSAPQHAWVERPER
jgi:hypothetical protein